MQICSPSVTEFAKIATVKKKKKGKAWRTQIQNGVWVSHRDTEASFCYAGLNSGPSSLVSLDLEPTADWVRVPWGLRWCCSTRSLFRLPAPGDPEPGLSLTVVGRAWDTDSTCRRYRVASENIRARRNFRSNSGKFRKVLGKKPQKPTEKIHHQKSHIKTHTEQTKTALFLGYGFCLPIWLVSHLSF